MESESNHCEGCTRFHSLSNSDTGELLSRHFDLRPVKDLLKEEILNKTGDPIGWFSHLEKSIKDAQQIFDPLAIAKTQNGLEILEGNHRAWFTYQYNLYAPAWIFESYCEQCTEDQFTRDMFEKTKEIGWLYEQQGF